MKPDTNIGGNIAARNEVFNEKTASIFLDRIRLILGRLHASAQPQDMNLPGLALHELRGRRKGTWSVKVSGNWRITFKFDGPDATDINYEDYH